MTLDPDATQAMQGWRVLTEEARLGLAALYVGPDSQGYFRPNHQRRPLGLGNPELNTQSFIVKFTRLFPF